MVELTRVLNEDRFPTLVEDMSVLVDDAISQQSGITGMAIKGTVGAAKKVNAQIVSKGLRRILPDLVRELAPHWTEFESSGQADFGDFLSQRSDQVTDSILKTADQHAQSLNNSTLQKAYGSMRGKGAKIIAPYVPQLGAVLQRNM